MARRFLPVFAAFCLILAATARWWPGWYWKARTINPVRTGAGLALKNGCLACHAPLEREQHADPGSRWGSVPSFYRGNLMMYAGGPGDVRKIISDGGPAPLAPAAAGAAPGKPPFNMPAFKNRLGSGEIDDLALYVMAADGYLIPDSGPVAQGFSLSRKFGCESCHGIGGSGGTPNPRSFTLAVPGWTGADFSHLVSGRGEFDEWLLDGRSKRMAGNRAASFFLDRANLYMPSFRGALKPGDGDALWAYIQFLREEAKKTR